MLKKILKTLSFIIVIQFILGAIIGLIDSHLELKANRRKLNFPAGLAVASFLRQCKTYM